MKIDQLQERQEITFTAQVQLWDAAIDISGMMLAGGVVAHQGAKLQPDKYKAYIEFSLAHAYPVVSSFGTSFHASTLKNSFASMLNQQFNYGHLLREYFKEEKGRDVREDRILGAVIAVDFPREPMGGWKITDYETSPGMHCIATVAKQAKGMDRVLGQYQTGRHDWTVSLELNYTPAESGVVLIPVQQGDLGSRARQDAISDEEKALMAKHTPDDYARAGLSYLPILEAPEELMDCFNLDKKIWSKPWKGHKIVTLAGGIGGNVDFMGTGLVRYGAEPAARIEQVLAEDKEMAAFADGLTKLSELLDRIA